MRLPEAPLSSGAALICLMRLMFGQSVPVILDDVAADGRTQIYAGVIALYFGHEIMNRYALPSRDIGERIPDDPFQPDAGAMIAERHIAGLVEPVYCDDLFHG